MIVGRNHVNQKKAHFLNAPARGVFYKENMEFHRLSSAFYKEYSHCQEILTKDDRPYYVLLLKLENNIYAIPLRSHISHPYSFIADTSTDQNSGLDFSKAVVIIDQTKYIEPVPVTIRQSEYNFFKQREHLIKKQFSSYVALYKKEVLRRIKNPKLPVSALCQYSSLKYFHQEMDLCN